MLWAFRQLMVPCNYLRIKQGDSLLQSKAVYDFVLPAILTGGMVGCWALLSSPLALHGHQALLKSLSDLMALLIAFYMAALAAVSTFERKGIDDKLKGGDATLKVLDHNSGKHKIKTLSYRQFISYLFGYLSFLSLILFLIILFADSAWPKIIKAIGDAWVWKEVINYAVDPIIFIAFFFGLSQLFITSLLGIYFLAERMQSLNDPEN